MHFNRSSHTRNLFFCGLFVSLLVPWATKAEKPNDILIIANKSVDATGVDMAELRDIFLKKKNQWKGGLNAVPVNAPPGTAIRDDFQKRLFGKSVNEMLRYWEEYKIRSGDTEPPQFPNALKAVFHMRGAVGYVYRAQYLKGVAKILLVLPAEE